jgi:IS30 family transposase
MGKDRKNPVTDEQIIEGYKRLLSVYKLSKEVGVAETTIYRILIKNGIERIGLGHYRKSAAKFTGEPRRLPNFTRREPRLMNYRKDLAARITPFVRRSRGPVVNCVRIRSRP